MPAVTADLVERVPDEDQWFERGAHVEFFDAPRCGRQRLELAALGSYEVLRCERLAVDGTRWLAVTLRPFRWL